MDPEETFIQRAVQFNIPTSVLKAMPVGEDKAFRLQTTASSTIKDLSGDEMTIEALQKMASSAEANMTIFLNHNYSVPEDIFGSVEKATVLQRGEFWDLDLQIRVDKSNERAVKVWESINNGTQLGTSIGALIPEGGATVTKTGLKISDVALLEASIVGLPANPRSFVQFALKALRKAERLESEEVEVSGPPITIRTQSVGINTNASGTPAVEVGSLPGLDAEKATTWVNTKPDGTADVIVESDQPVAEPASETANDSGKAAKAVEPDTTKEAQPPADAADAADVTPAEGGDAGEEPADDVPATQEAPPQSDPENEGSDTSTADVPGDEQIEAHKALGIEALATVLKTTAHTAIDLRRALDAQIELRKAAETRASDAEANLELAKQIVDRIRALPMGRKAGFAAETDTFRQKFAHLYGDDTINFIERETNGSDTEERP